MSEKPLPPQYGNYYDQQRLSDKTVSNITSVAEGGNGALVFLGKVQTNVTI